VAQIGLGTKGGGEIWGDKKKGQVSGKVDPSHTLGLGKILKKKKERSEGAFLGSNTIVKGKRGKWHVDFGNHKSRTWEDGRRADYRGTKKRTN